MGRNRRASMAALSAAVLPALLAALPGSPPAMRAAAGPRDAERGLYVLAGDFPPSRWREIVDAPGIAGVAVTLTWRRVEPREGEFDWAELDEALAVATSMGRLVTLRLVPGIHTPEWVYAGGAHRFRFTDRNPGHDAATYGRMNPDYATFGKELSLPVPWDEAFLAPWLRTVGAMGAHLGGCEGLGMVHVTAANTHGTEMFLPRGKEDRARWLEAGYSKERLISVWRRAVDAFAAAFPDAPLALDLSPTLFRDGVAASVARYGVE